MSERQKEISLSLLALWGYAEANPAPKQMSAALPVEETVRKYKGKTIKKRPDGRYWTRYYKDGVQHSVYGKTASECVANLKQAMSGNAPAAAITLDEWLEQWIKLYKINKVRQTTVNKITGLLKCVDDKLRSCAINKITSIDVQRFLNGIEFERKREQVYVCLKDAFTRAHKNKLIKENPFDVVEIAKAKRQRRSKALTVSEEKRFIEACSRNKYGNLFLLCLYQGLRLGEALALTEADVDTEKMTLTVNKSLNGDGVISPPKTETSNRTMPLFRRSLDVLPHVGKGERLFAATTRKYYQKQIHQICRELELENVSAHTLRHTFATRCSEAGVPPKVVQKWLGHATLEMTLNVYTHVNAEEEQKETLKFDTYFDTCFC